MRKTLKIVFLRLNIIRYQAPGGYFLLAANKKKKKYVRCSLVDHNEKN